MRLRVAPLSNDQEERRYQALIDSIGEAVRQGRSQVVRAANASMLQTYWEIGRYIVEYEQKGQEKAGYGDALLTRLSRDLRLRYGEGFSKSNVFTMRRLYLLYPKFQTLSGKLTWSHYTELSSAAISSTCSTGSSWRRNLSVS